jgi:hypothetical protein
MHKLSNYASFFTEKVMGHASFILHNRRGAGSFSLKHTAVQAKILGERGKILTYVSIGESKRRLRS